MCENVCEENCTWGSFSVNMVYFISIDKSDETVEEEH